MPAGSTYSTIATTTLGSAQASVTFSSLGSYTDLILVDNTKSSVTDTALNLTFNGDTTSGLYSSTFMFGSGTSAISAREPNFNSIYISRANTTNGAGITHIQNYGNSTTYKTVLSRGNDTDYVFAWVGLWRNTNAITSLRVTPGGQNFATGSTFTLYGISAA